MEQLIHEYRGEILENIHFGRICVVDENRNVIRSVGDVQMLTYFRSASKPIQALPVIDRNLHKKYGFSDNEVAIMCGSHLGEKVHLETILSMLEKTGLKEEEFIMLPNYPSNSALKQEMLKNNLPPRKALHNCSGKHVATMVLAKELTGTIDGYWKTDHPAQQEILKYVADFSEYPQADVKIGIDGCGVPVFAVPLKNISIAFMKMACPDKVEDETTRQSLIYIQKAINENSVMLRGQDQVCDVFNRDTNIIAKGGALGVYGFGMKEERIGASFKMENGPGHFWQVMVAEMLKQLNYKNSETIKAINEKCVKLSVFNDNKDEIGKIQTVFKL